MSSPIPEGARAIAETLAAAGGPARLVGGAVRDILDGRTPKDFDLATPLPPTEVASATRRAGFSVHETGLQHGTLTIVAFGTPYEVTTLRRDVETDGRHARVAWTDDWKEDAERRDLTFNAMSLAMDGTLHDYFDGRDDLAARRVRFVGDADRRLKEDQLRQLRLFRFLGRWPGATVDPEAVDAVRANLPGLDRLSGERVWMEMGRILTGPDVAGPLALMRDTGVLARLRLPEDRIAAAATAAAHTAEPVAVLVELTRGKGTAELAERWKWSRRERDMAVFLERNPQGVRHVRAARAHLAGGARREHVVVAAELAGAPDVAAAAREMDAPVFPVRGEDLMTRGIGQGPEMGQSLARLREAWAKSDFRAEAEELLADFDRARRDPSGREDDRSGR